MGSLFGIPTLIIGLILLIAGGSWFSHAATVGLILTIASGVWIILWSLIAILAIWAMSK